MIDRDVLGELSQSIGDDPEFLRELIETYLDDAPAQIAAMRGALASGDAERLNRAAHTLKSNSASVGAMQLAELCRELEALSEPATADAATLAERELVTRADAIAEQFELVRTELDALVPADAA